MFVPPGMQIPIGSPPAIRVARNPMDLSTHAAHKSSPLRRRGDEKLSLGVVAETPRSIPPWKAHEYPVPGVPPLALFTTAAGRRNKFDPFDSRFRITRGHDEKSPVAGHYGDPFDDFPPGWPPAKEKKWCSVEVWRATIFLWVVHLWIEVKHCDGKRERFEVWQELLPKYRRRPESEQLGGHGSHVYRNLLHFRSQPGNTSNPRKVSRCSWIFDCGSKNSKVCKCFSTKTALKYCARHRYSYTGINSNTFVAQFLKHCGLKCDFPSGAIGVRAWSRPQYDFFEIEDYDAWTQTNPGGPLRRDYPRSQWTRVIHGAW